MKKYRIADSLSFRLTLLFVFLFSLPLIVIFFWIGKNFTDSLLNWYLVDLKRKTELIASMFQSEENYSRDDFLSQIPDVVPGSIFLIFPGGKTVVYQNPVYPQGTDPIMYISSIDPSVFADASKKTLTYIDNQNDLLVGIAPAGSARFLVVLEDLTFYRDISSLEAEDLVLFFVLSFSLISLIAGILIALMIGRPLRILTRAAYTMGQNRDGMDFSMSGMTGELKILADIMVLTEGKIREYQNNLEDKVLERSARIEQLNKELFQREKMASLGELVAGIAHEVNTPIGINVTLNSRIKARTEKIISLWKNDSLTFDDLESYFSEMDEISRLSLDASKRAADLIKKFKMVAVDQSSEDKREFYPVSYFRDVLDSLYPSVKKRGNILVNIFGDDTVKISSYPGLFAQILTNLIINSLDHGFEKLSSGEINIKVIFEEKLMIIDYTDNGRGMDEETSERIFDPFFTTKRSSGGTGLGMNIVYNIINGNLNGNILCRSKPGEGAYFRITIPLGLS